MASVKSTVGRLAAGGLAGLVAAAVAVGVGELVAAFVRPAASPIVAVGNRFIVLTPEPVKQWAIRHFGSNDKHMLLLGIYLVIAVLAVVVGIVSQRSIRLGAAGLVLFGAVGVYAALTANAARGSDVVPTIVGTLCAVWTLAALTRRQRVATVAGGPGRRAFLAGSIAAAAGATLAGFAGRALQNTRFDAANSRAAVRLPAPASPAPPLPAGVDLHKGAVPFVTPNQNFYRVDTALAVPQLDTQSWRLRIHGMVEHPMTLTFDDVLSRPLIERYITMTCVSNYVGGPYISTARFLGARLADVLREAGVHTGADQIVGRSSDGMTIGTPTAVIMDGRDALLAVGMNGEPLPLEHGFPVRTVVPGLYGYVSATKWLVDLEATRFSSYDAYWVRQGWVAKGPIVIESRIDTPAPFARIQRGRQVVIAGVAWYQHVGIDRVQVQIGNGPWTDAQLGRVPSIDTWVQWALPWTVTEHGQVALRVRAVGRDGTVQPGTGQQPFPYAATGWHTVVVTAH